MIVTMPCRAAVCAVFRAGFWKRGETASGGKRPTHPSMVVRKTSLRGALCRGDHSFGFHSDVANSQQRRRIGTDRTIPPFPPREIGDTMMFAMVTSRSCFRNRRRSPFRASVWLACVACWWCALAPGEAVAEPAAATFKEPPSAADFLRELERRELDRVAMAWCRDRLANGKPTPEERFDLTMGLARGAARGAMAEFGADRDILWDESRTWLETLRAEVPEARRIEVDLAAVELLQLRGDWERRWAELRPFDTLAARQARTRLVEAFDGVGDVIARLEKRPSQKGLESDGLVRPWDLMTERSGCERGCVWICGNWLERIRRRHLAVGHGNRVTRNFSRVDVSRGSGEGTAESPGGSGVVGRIASPVRTIAGGCGSARGYCAAIRIVRFLDHARTVVRRTPAVEEVHHRTGRRRGGRVCAAGAGVRMDAAGSGLRAHSRYLRQRLVLDRVPREETVRPLVERIRAFSASAPRSWGLLGQQLEDTVVHLAKFGPITAPLAEKAKSDYFAGRFDESIKAYLDAAESARKQADRDSEFELTYRAASILLDRKRYDEAARRLSTLVDDHPQHPDAATADLLACHALGWWPKRLPAKRPRRRSSRG